MRRLLWRLFLSYFVLIALCAAGLGVYAWRTFRAFFVAQSENHLRLQAQLIRDRIDLPLDKEHQPAIETFCQRAGRLGECRVTMIGRDGEVIGESHRNPESMQNHATRPEVREAMAGRVGVSVRFSQTADEEMVYVAIPLDRAGAAAGSAPADRPAGVVRVAMPLTRINQELAGTYTRIAAGAVLAILLAGLLALWISRGISRPIVEIRSGAARFAGGDLGHRIYVPPIEELKALAESLNEMASQLGERLAAESMQRTRQEAILASMSEGVVAVDDSGCVLTMNGAAGRLLAVDPARVLNRPINEVVRKAALERLVEQVLARGEPAEIELTLKLPGQPGQAGPGPGPISPQEHVVQVVATPLRDAQARNLGALLVLNDLTRLRRLERVRQDFVANVSHELKTPITSIKGFVETLRDGAAEQPEQAKRFLEIIAHQADRLGAIIEDLLALSRLEQEAGRSEIRLEVGDLSAVIAQAVAVCQLKAEARQVRIEVDCPAGLTARINAALLEQAVSNLLDNAIKYSEPGQAVAVTAAAGGVGVDIRVRDHGCGIPAEHLPRLFERFYRVDQARSRKVGGTGLGLAIVKHIAAAHGGTASVTSSPGAGSTFSIHLPG